MLLSSGELFRRTDLKRPVVARRRLGRVIDSFLELHEGDLVVHVAHGIARYRGLKLLEKNGQVEEHLELEFQGKTKLYVPTAKIGLVQKYVGGTKGRPMLARLGGRTWDRQKQKVREAVTDLAAEMLDLQAVRASRPGITFHRGHRVAARVRRLVPLPGNPRPTRHDRGHQAATCASRGRWTACSAATWATARPRWRCGRRSRPIDNGYQVAVLVPTTVLAEQHFRTFTARMAEFPFEIAALSRFATPQAAVRDHRAAWQPARSTSSSARTGWSSRTSASTTWAW